MLGTPAPLNNGFSLISFIAATRDSVTKLTDKARAFMSNKREFAAADLALVKRSRSDDGPSDTVPSQAIVRSSAGTIITMVRGTTCLAAAAPRTRPQTEPNATSRSSCLSAKHSTCWTPAASWQRHVSLLNSPAKECLLLPKLALLLSTCVGTLPAQHRSSSTNTDVWWHSEPLLSI
jgi:hypothetical protein